MNHNHQLYFGHIQGFLPDLRPFKKHFKEFWKTKTQKPKHVHLFSQDLLKLLEFQWQPVTSS